tara:strand:- start:38 stop:412 length:375 start_codon:yes stop_codon:yes gene_type:complete
MIKIKAISLLSFLLIMSFNQSLADQSSNNKLYKRLITEIRCMVCQNQSIAESEAPLAVDLRNKVKLMINEGRDEEYIKKFMAQRYSSFILYDPPINYQNLILWSGPFIFLIMITYILFRRNLRR